MNVCVCVCVCVRARACVRARVLGSRTHALTATCVTQSCLRLCSTSLKAKSSVRLGLCVVTLLSGDLELSWGCPTLLWSCLLLTFEVLQNGDEMQ